MVVLVAASQCTVCFLVAPSRWGALFGTLNPLCKVLPATAKNSPAFLQSNVVLKTDRPR